MTQAFMNRSIWDKAGPKEFPVNFEFASLPGHTRRFKLIPLLCLLEVYYSIGAIPLSLSKKRKTK